jgi:hypothetical protein
VEDQRFEEILLSGKAAGLTSGRAIVSFENSGAPDRKNLFDWPAW